jgi:hypothetical protein
MTPRRRRFNMLISEDEHRMLCALAYDDRLSLSDYLRHEIVKSFRRWAKEHGKTASEVLECIRSPSSKP